MLVDNNKDCTSWLLDRTGVQLVTFISVGLNGLFKSSPHKFPLAFKNEGTVPGRENEHCQEAKTDEAASNILSTNSREIWSAPCSVLPASASSQISVEF